jgi:glycosyltransferase involved in cell wall biosynthesis
MVMTRPVRPRVLIVAYDFPPHAAIGTMRTLRVVQQLVRANWDVTVLTSDPRSFRAGTPHDDRLLASVPPQVRVVRAGVWRGFEALKGMVRKSVAASPRHDGAAPASSPTEAPGGKKRERSIRGAVDLVDAMLAIPDNESGWIAPAVMQGLAACRGARPDVIYSSAPPWTGQLVARTLAGCLQRPWVADFRDPWSRAPWREDRRQFALTAARVLERAVVRRADRVLFVAQANRDEFASRYGEAVAGKFVVIPNGCDPAEFDLLERTAPRLDDEFVLLHAGSLYAGRTPEPLLRAIATAVHRGTVDPRHFKLRFLGTVGLQSVDLPRLLRELSLEGIVEFVPRVPRYESVRAMMSASALLLLQPGHSVSVPGKLYEYLAAGRPILSIAEEGETADLVRASGIGVSVGPDDESRIVDALASVQEMVRSSVQPPPRELFDGMARAADVVQVLESIAGRGVQRVVEVRRSVTGRIAS